MVTTLLDVRETFKKAGHTDAQADEITRVLDNYIKSDAGLTSHSDFSELKGMVKATIGLHFVTIGLVLGLFFSR